MKMGRNALCQKRSGLVKNIVEAKLKKKWKTVEGNKIMLATSYLWGSSGSQIVLIENFIKANKYTFYDCNNQERHKHRHKSLVRNGRSYDYCFGKGPWLWSVATTIWLAEKRAGELASPCITKNTYISSILC